MSKKKDKKKLSLFIERVDNIFFWVFFFIVLLSPYYRGLYFRLERYPFLAIICVGGIIYLVFRHLRRSPLVIPKNLFLPFALLVLLYGINVFFAADHGLAHQEFVNYGVYCLFFLLLASLEAKISSGLILLFFGANAVILSLLGLFQGLGWISQDTYFLGMALRAMFDGGRLSATFQYPNTASAYFGMGYLALLGASMSELKAPWRHLSYFLAFLALGGVFFTYSRGGVLALGFTVLLLMLLLPQREKVNFFLSFIISALLLVLISPPLERLLSEKSPLFFLLLCAGGLLFLGLRYLFTFLEEYFAGWSERKFLLLFLALLLAGGGMFFLLVQTGVIAGQAARLLDLSLQSRSIWERLVFYRDGLRLFLERPLNGWGGGGWEALYFSVRSFPYVTRTTHNFYLQVLIEGGVIGIALLGFLLFYLFYSGWKKVRSRCASPWVGILWGIVFLGFFHGLVDFNFNLGAYQLTMWFLVGCAVWAFIDKSEKKASFSLPPLFLVIPLVLFCTLSSLYVTSELRVITGDHFMQKGEWDTAIVFYEQALRFEPWNPRPHYSLGLAFHEKFLAERKSAQRERAIAEGERALRLAPRNASILESLGVWYAEWGAFDKAIPFLKEAIEQDPFNLSPYRNLAKVCQVAGEYSLQEDEIEKALSYLEEGEKVEEYLNNAEKRSLRPLDWDTKEVLAIIEEMKELKREILSLREGED